jgi:hypothetical protein
MTNKRSTASKTKQASKTKPAPTVRLGSAEGLNAEKVSEPKLTVKQEKFAQAYIETGNASEAYRRAYDAAKMKEETIWRNAHELLNNSKVATRVDQLKSQHQERHEITVDDLVAELESARALAERIETPAAMVAASMGKAKLLGLVIDKGELTGKNGKPLIPENLSTQQIALSVMQMLNQGRVEDLPPIDMPDAREIETTNQEPETALETADHPRIRTFNPESGKLEDA